MNGFEGTIANCYRKTLKLRDKLMRFKLHKETLEQYINMDLIPKGLQVHMTPSFGKNDPEFMSNWESILHNCSLQLVKLVKNQCEHICVNVEDNLVFESNSLVDSISDPDELDQVHNTMDSIINKRKRRIKKTKQRKLTRDISIKTKRVMSLNSIPKVTKHAEISDIIQRDPKGEPLQELDQQIHTDWPSNSAHRFTIENTAMSTSKTTCLLDVADFISTEPLCESPAVIFPHKSLMFHTPEKAPPKTPVLKSPDFHIPEFLLQTPQATSTT